MKLPPPNVVNHNTLWKLPPPNCVNNTTNYWNSFQTKPCPYCIGVRHHGGSSSRLPAFPHPYACIHIDKGMERLPHASRPKQAASSSISNVCMDMYEGIGLCSWQTMCMQIITYGGMTTTKCCKQQHVVEIMATQSLHIATHCGNVCNHMLEISARCGGYHRQVL